MDWKQVRQLTITTLDDRFPENLTRSSHCDIEVSDIVLATMEFQTLDGRGRQTVSRTSLSQLLMI